MIQYYEIDLASTKRPNDSYSICIKTTHRPTSEEVAKFLAKDMEELDYDQVVGVFRIKLEAAKEFYDMSNEANFPILD